LRGNERHRFPTRGPSYFGSPKEGDCRGHQTKRLAAVRQRADRLVHRHGAIDPLFQASDPARTAGACVTFEPGARTAWHTHPLGQTLIVTCGVGRVQRLGWSGRGNPAGRRRLVSTRRKHCHGASPTKAMTHIAIQEVQNGKVVDWLEHVSDEQYGK
jgi:quercetin dioxygenase-like cupin family protein